MLLLKSTKIENQKHHNSISILQFMKSANVWISFKVFGFCK